jgi:signal transduction histidine kinase
MQQERPAEAAERIEHLERLVAQMRHDVCGALSPALLMADLLLNQPDPKVRLAAERIVQAIERTTTLVRASRATVPPRGMPVA